MISLTRLEFVPLHIQCWRLVNCFWFCNMHWFWIMHCESCTFANRCMYMHTRSYVLLLWRVCS